ncbi:hypothetical protein H4582DRAFT_2064399 [Lactarius indigo]|nr:hypothetical protein H4582DRAFT_2064399 [Lactarius indigo]
MTRISRRDPRNRLIIAVGPSDSSGDAANETPILHSPTSAVGNNPTRTHTPTWSYTEVMNPRGMIVMESFPLPFSGNGRSADLPDSDGSSNGCFLVARAQLLATGNWTHDNVVRQTGCGGGLRTTPRKIEEVRGLVMVVVTVTYFPKLSTLMSLKLVASLES